MEKFVTTKAEYQFDTELDDYVPVSREGYLYDGDWSMAGGQPSPPPAPDPREIAETDAEFNRIDQHTPFGSLTFSGPSRNVSTLEFSPEVQGLTNQRLQSDQNLLAQALQRQGTLDPNQIDLSQFGPIQSNINTEGINFQGPQTGPLPGLGAPNLQGSFDTSGLPQIPQNIEQFRGDVEQAVFDRGQALLDPVFGDQERRLDQKLANQGLPQSGEAVDRDKTRFADARNRAFTDLANAATITGGQEASRSLGDILGAQGQGFNQALTSTGFANQTGLLGLGADQGIRGQLFGEGIQGAGANNQASQLNLAMQQQLLNNQNAGRAQGLGEAQGIRGNAFNELQALLGGQQVQAPQQSNFFAPGQADTTGAFALNQQAQQNDFNADVSQQNALTGGLFGLGGSILGGPIGGALAGGIGGRQGISNPNNMPFNFFGG